MQLPTAILLFTLPVFSILAPLIQGLSNRLHSRLMVAYWSILGLVITLGGVTAALSAGTPKTEVFYGALSIDSFSVYFTAVFVGITLLISIASVYYMRQQEP